MIYRILLIALSWVLLSGSLMAQEIIHGKVMKYQEDEPKPLIGANVFWLGTTQGTVTDEHGHFEIKSPGENAHYLVVSFVGFRTDTVHVHSHAHDHEPLEELEIVLRETSQLDEVAILHRKSGSHISRQEPIHTHIINEEELCKAACCNLSESFETNASVDVSYADAATGVKRIQMLGLSGSYVQLITENNPNFSGLSSNYGLEYIPGSWMESIQISKGASSVTNGYEAITGQINVELKKPDGAEKGFLNLFANSNQRMEVNAGAAIPLSESLSTSVMAHGSYMNKKWDNNSDGFLDDPLIKRYALLNRWNYQREYFSAQLGLTLIQEDRLGGQLKFNENAPRTTENGYGVQVNTNRLDGFFKAGYVFKSNDESSLALISNYTRHAHDSYYGIRTYDAAQKTFYTRLLFQSTIGSEKHRYSTGLSYNYSALNEQFIAAPYDQFEESVPGVFAQYTLDLDDRFILLTGLRADYHSEYKGFITPRVHVKYEVNEDLILRSSAGKGYRTPFVFAENTWLMTTARTFVLEDDPVLEEAWNYGMSITRYFYIFERPLTLIGDVYRTRFINQMVTDIDSDSRLVRFYALDGESFSNNYQIDAKYEPVNNLELNLAYRFSDVRVTIQDALIEKALVNRYKGLFAISWQTNRKTWQIDYNTQWNGDGRLPGLQDKELRHPSFFLMNGQITRYFNKLDIYSGVENLTGFVQDNPIISADNPFSDEFDASQIWGPVQGRRLYIGLRYRFE